MTNLRRKVPVLLVALALFASACSDEPSEVLAAGDDGDASERVEEASDTSNTAANADSFSAVAEDSAPIAEITDVPDDVSELLAEVAANSAVWEEADLSDYDYSIALTSPEFNLVAQVEVRDGEETRQLSHPVDDQGFGDFSTIFPDLSTAILDGDDQERIDDVSFDPELGIPTRIAGLTEGQPAHLEIFRFRTLDEYPESCSTQDLDFAGPTSNDPVALTQAALLNAAQTCDFLMLSHLGDQGTQELIVGSDGGGVERLWQAEKSGELRLGIIAELLSEEPALLPDGTAVWPKEFAGQGSGYLDWRVGISAEGEWLFFERN